MSSAPNDPIPLRGAISEALIMENRGELTTGDLVRLAEGPRSGVPILQKLSAIHHQQARMIAEGKQLVEIATTLGCTTQRLTQLKLDPAFKELISFYQDQIATQSIDDAARLQRKILIVGEQAVEEIMERLADDETRKRISMGNLTKIAEFGMDRTVAPPKAIVNNQNPPTEITISFGTSLRESVPTRPAQIIEHQEEQNEPVVEKEPS